MSGKRISREKLTIKKMIDLYQAKCPQASAEPEHYEALLLTRKSGWINVCSAKRNQPVSSVRCTVTSLQSVKR